MRGPLFHMVDLHCVFQFCFHASHGFGQVFLWHCHPSNKCSKHFALQLVNRLHLHLHQWQRWQSKNEGGRNDRIKQLQPQFQRNTPIQQSVLVFLKIHFDSVADCFLQNPARYGAVVRTHSQKVHGDAPYAACKQGCSEQRVSSSTYMRRPDCAKEPAIELTRCLSPNTATPAAFVGCVKINFVHAVAFCFAEPSNVPVTAVQFTKHFCSFIGCIQPYSAWYS